MVFGFAGALVPIAIGIAILRHGLYDIDRLISRTVGYARSRPCSRGCSGWPCCRWAWSSARSPQGQTIAVAGSTLLVAALFGPLRRRAQAIVDRRFDRGSYDAAMTLQAHDRPLARRRRPRPGGGRRARRRGPDVPSGNCRDVAPRRPDDEQRAYARSAWLSADRSVRSARSSIRVVLRAPFVPAAFGFGPAAMVGLS